MHEEDIYSDDDVENGLDFSWRDELPKRPAQPEREICSDCGGTGLDLVGDTDGSCPGCINGYRFN